MRRSAPNVPRCKEILFAQAYLAQGSNATAAYRTLFPRASRQGAAEQGGKYLRRPTVQAELARFLRVEAGITRALLESDLLHARALALDGGDPQIIASVVMDCAKLAGLLVEKHEDVSTRLRVLSDEDFERALDARLRALTDEASTVADARAEGVRVGECVNGESSSLPCSTPALPATEKNSGTEPPPPFGTMP